MSTDVQTALNANGKGILRLRAGAEKEREKTEDLMTRYHGRVFMVNDMVEAADLILEDVK